MEALSQFERIGISLKELEAYKTALLSVTGVDQVDLTALNSFSLLKMWVQGRASIHPTWRHFIWALREIKLNNLADQIESFFSGVAVEKATISILDVSTESEQRDGREEDSKQEQGEVK